MAKSGHTFSKRQREKEKAKRRKEKRERMDERKVSRQNGESGGITIDWESAPVNTTLSKDDEARKAAIKTKEGGDIIPERPPRNREAFGNREASGNREATGNRDAASNRDAAGDSEEKKE